MPVGKAGEEKAGGKTAGAKKAKKKRATPKNKRAARQLAWAFLASDES